MPSWTFYAIGTAVILASADFFVKLAAGKLSNNVALLLFGASTFTIALVWILWERSQGITQYAQTSGLLIGVAVGVAFTFVTLGLYITFGSGAPISLASPFIRLGGLIMASIAGVALLGEPLNLQYIIGVILAISGMYLIVTR